MMHIPVLLEETLQALLPEDKIVERAIDGTLGAGGHTHALLEAGVQSVLAFDLDSQAIQLAQATLSDYTERVDIVQASYEAMAQVATQRGWQGVDAILLDVGVSSMQFDTAERGFSFRADGPLDMRFTASDSRPTAATIVNNWDAEALAHIFYRYGEEQYGRRIARAIVAQRPFTTTQALAEVVAAAAPDRYKRRIHPATQVFQALRIAVNDELGVIERTLPLAINLLRQGGRLAVISFHSLEDRIVKQHFKEASTAITAPPGMASIEEREAVVKLVNRKPIVPSAAEVERNPRSRSSKLRVVEKL